MADGRLRVLVTGASSFVGAHFCRVAAARHLVLASHHRTPLGLAGVVPVRCDLRHPLAVERLRALCPDVVVHLAAKAKGEDVAALNRRLLDVVLEVGAPVVYASSTMVHWPVQTAYAAARREDEARVQASGLPWAVVRPCAPYGPRLKEHRPGRDESFLMLARWARWSPVVPIPGDGTVRRQPVHVEDFAEAILALVEDGLPGRAFDAAGPQPLSLDALVDALAALHGRRVARLHLPGTLFAAAARLHPDLDPALLAVLTTDDVADPGPLAEATGVCPRPFLQGVTTLV